MVHRYLTFFLLSVLSLHSFSSETKETIHWQTYHLPPGSIRLEPNKYQGFVDKVLALVIKEMPNYDHSFPTTSLARAIADLKGQKKVCHPGLLVSEERKQYIHFSQGSVVHPTNRLVGLKGSLDNLLVNGIVDLNNFPQDATFALVKNRVYSAGYEEFAKHDINKEQLVAISLTKVDALFYLVGSKRVDFTIAYPFELEYFRNTHDDAEDNLMTYRLPNTPAFSIGHIGCPKNAWGKKVIAEIDKVLDRIKSTEEYKKAMTSWWEKEADTDEFQRFYKESFLKKK